MLTDIQRDAARADARLATYLDRHPAVKTAVQAYEAAGYPRATAFIEKCRAHLYTAGFLTSRQAAALVAAINERLPV